MPIKTLHLTNSWHETSGGIATFYRALIEAANQRQQNIRLVVPGDHDRMEELGAFGKIYHLRAPHALFNSGYRTIYPGQFLAARSKLQEIIASERPDVVEICDKYTLNYLGGLLRRQLLPAIGCRPVVIGFSCERMDDNFRTYIGRLPLARQFCSLYMKWLYFPFFDHHIANSGYTADELRTAAKGQMVRRDTWVRPMGVDLNRLSPRRRCAETRRALLRNFGLPDNSVLLLYVGRLVPEKNLALLFGTLAHLGSTETLNYRLIVVGDGIERSRWETYAAKRTPDRTRFLGHIKERDVLADLYANADVFVHPNPREPFGIAPLEAMASGLPLVAPDRGGVREYATESNAWLAQPDVERFAMAVADAATSGKNRAAKTENALKTAENYRWENVAGSFLDLYSELCRRPQAQGADPLAPAFYSTPATGLQGLLFQCVSRTAEGVVRRLARRASAGSATELAQS